LFDIAIFSCDFSPHTIVAMIEMHAPFPQPRPSTKTALPVLVVGSGPVGLALAIELGQRGVSCVVVERNDRVGYAPRAKTTNVRTREHLRRWGIAEQLRAVSPFGVSYPSNVLFVTRLAGVELTRFENAMYCAPGRNPLYSEHGQWIPQYHLEEVMRAHAQSLPSVSIRFNCELKSLDQHDDGVEAQLLDRKSSTTRVERFSYVVGADGAGSRVRDMIGARLEGQRGLSRNLNVVFRAPGLAQAHAHGPAIMYWQINNDLPSVIGPLDQGDRWYFMPTQLPSEWQGEASDVRAMIARATGIDLPYEILSTDEWEASRLIADRYRDRRVFLAGDACHLHPPFGGYGMNMGIADGVDLGWKLAAVLQGWGGEGLLESYALERRPIHEKVLEEAVINHSTLGRQLAVDGMEAETPHGAQIRSALGARIQAAKMREFATLGIVLGDWYGDSPIVVGDGDPGPVKDFINYVPSSRPGGRAPHAWLHDGSSLFDHFGAGFTLVVSAQMPMSDMESWKAPAQALAVPLKIIQCKEAALTQLYPTHFTLIRPDQHVAWRGDDWAGVGVDVLRTALGRAKR
jgi:2-polyprenyl-6-methoxyphenol hydroxylase-like FAD-dependent oxidoreductase